MMLRQNKLNRFRRDFMNSDHLRSMDCLFFRFVSCRITRCWIVQNFGQYRIVRLFWCRIVRKDVELKQFRLIDKFLITNLFHMLNFLYELIKALVMYFWDFNFIYFFKFQHWISRNDEKEFRIIKWLREKSCGQTSNPQWYADTCGSIEYL